MRVDTVKMEVDLVIGASFKAKALLSAQTLYKKKKNITWNRGRCEINLYEKIYSYFDGISVE